MDNLNQQKPKTSKLAITAFTLAFLYTLPGISYVTILFFSLLDSQPPLIGNIFYNLASIPMLLGYLSLPLFFAFLLGLPLLSFLFVTMAYRNIKRSNGLLKGKKLVIVSIILLPITPMFYFIANLSGLF